VPRRRRFVDSEGCDRIHDRIAVRLAKLLISQQIDTLAPTWIAV
jgi:hypothetical protein